MLILRLHIVAKIRLIATKFLATKDHGTTWIRHSPSGLPFDLKIAQRGHPIKRFLPLGDPELRRRLNAGASCFELVPCWPGGDDFQRFGQTCPAAFVQFGVGPLSDAYRRRSQSADGGKDGAHHWASDSHLGELEGDGP